MEILHVINKGRSMDTIEKFHIYKETKNCNQINVKNTVKPNIIFDIEVRGGADRAHTLTQPHDRDKNQSRYPVVHTRRTRYA
jgi:hypothetical protein